MLDVVRSKVARNITQRSESFMVISIVVQKSKKVSPASLKKVRAVRKLSAQKKMEGFRLFDMSTFSNLISSLACPECYECVLYTNEQYNKKKGLAPFFVNKL